MAQHNVDVGNIASTYTARVAERTYRHLRRSMEKDDKTHEFVKSIMETPLRVLQMRPSFGCRLQPNLNNMALHPVIRHDPGSALFPPGPDCSFLKHIESAYKNLKHMQYKRFLTHMNASLQRQPSGEPLEEYPGDPDLVRVEGWLHDRVKLAENYLSLKLSGRTKILCPPTFGSRIMHVMIFMLSCIWLIAGFVLLYLSALDDRYYAYGAVIVEKHADYNVTISNISKWCLLGVSQEQIYQIEHPFMNYDAVISYLESRRWRSSVFSNLALLVLGAMIAKIITNFVSGEPGFGGFRLNGTIDFGWFKHTFRHKDLELKYDPKYHVRRYLEENGIFVPDLNRKYAIDQLYETYTDAEESYTMPTQSPSSLLGQPMPSRASSVGSNRVDTSSGGTSPPGAVTPQE